MDLEEKTLLLKQKTNASMLTQSSPDNSNYGTADMPEIPGEAKRGNYAPMSLWSRSAPSNLSESQENMLE